MLNIYNENARKNSLISTGNDTVTNQINDNKNSIFKQLKSMKEFIIPSLTKIISSRSEYCSSSGKG